MKTCLYQNKQKFSKREIKPTFVIILLWIIYFTWSFFIVNKGIDLTDSAYVFSLYKYAFYPEAIKGLGIAMSEILGGILWNIIPTAHALVMSFVGSGLCLGSGLFIYHTLKKYLPGIPLLLILLCGSLFSLGWFHYLHYDTWTVFFLSLEIFLLFQWFHTLDRKKLFWCGIVYGINIYIRLPNVLHGICIISIIWFILWHDERKKLWKDLGVMLVGVLLSLGVTTIIVVNWIGGDNFLREIGSYFSRATGQIETTGYSIYDSIFVIAQYYTDGIGQALKDIILCMLIVLLEKLGLRWLQKYISKDTLQKNILVLNVVIGILAGILVFIWNYSKELNLSVCISLGTILGFAAAWCFRKKDIVLSSLCLAAALIELIFKIGTNNGVKFHVIFITLPIGIFAAALIHLGKGRLQELKNLYISFLLTLTLLGGIHEAATYVYRDAGYSELTTPVEAEEYKGMLTNSERAEMINTMNDLLNQLPAGRLLMIGKCNIGYIISDHAPIGKAWLDVSSYSFEKFNLDLTEKFETGERPYIVIVTPDQYSDLAIDEQKTARVYEWIHEYQYVRQYSDSHFELWLPVM